jgi:glycerol-3-phosphate dehydrogenase
VLSPEEISRELPLAAATQTGGLLFQETLCDRARLALELVDGASRARALAVNRATALALLTEGRRVVGAVIQDRETEKTVEVRSLVTACCAGPWNRALMPPGCEVPRGELPGKRIHLVLPALPTEHVLAIGIPGGRTALLLPWFGRTLVRASSGEPLASCSEPRVEAAEVREVLRQVSSTLDLPWGDSDVVAAFATLHAPPSDVLEPEEPMDSLLVLRGGAGVLSRRAASFATDRALQMLSRPAVPCSTADRPLPWCAGERGRAFDVEVLRRGLALGLDEETLANLSARYGARVEDLLARVRETPALGRRIVADAPFCQAELVHAVGVEMAETLEDVLRHRVPIQLVSSAGERAVHEVAAVLGALRQWPEERRQREIDLLLGREVSAAEIRVGA